MNRNLLTGLKILSAGALLTASGGILSAQSDTVIQEKIKKTEQAVTDYVFQRQQLAQAKNEWNVYKEVSERRVEFFSQEIERLEGEIEKLEGKRSTATRIIGEKKAKIEELEAANRVVLEKVPEYEVKLRELSQYFPDPLKRRVSATVEQLGRPTQAADRMVIVIGILNEIDKFNSEWTIDSSRVGNSLVDVLYMGLAGGYYASEDGTIGGILVPAKGGWTMEEDNSVAQGVALAIKYYRNEIKPAALVPVPAKVSSLPNN